MFQDSGGDVRARRRDPAQRPLERMARRREQVRVRHPDWRQSDAGAADRRPADHGVGQPLDAVCMQVDDEAGDPPRTRAQLGLGVQH